MPSLHNPHAQPNRCFYLYISLASCMLVFPAHLSPRPRPSIVPACLLVDPGSPAPISLAQQVRCSSVLPLSCSKIHLSAASFLPKELNTHEEAYQQRILNGQPSNHRSTRYTTISSQFYYICSSMACKYEKYNKFMANDLLASQFYILH